MSRSKRGLHSRKAAGIESSIDRPEMPVVQATVTLLATLPGATANPASRSAVTGTSTLLVIARRCLITFSSATPVSGRPIDQAKPEIVGARAGEPSRARSIALPRSHGVAITEQPDA